MIGIKYAIKDPTIGIGALPKEFSTSVFATLSIGPYSTLTDSTSVAIS